MSLYQEFDDLSLKITIFNFVSNGGRTMKEKGTESG